MRDGSDAVLQSRRVVVWGSSAGYTGAAIERERDLAFYEAIARLKQRAIPEIVYVGGHIPQVLDLEANT